MTSIQQTVSSLLSKEVCVNKNLSQKLINSRALARFLIKKYNLNTSLDSVISSIRRYDIKKQEEDKKRVLALFKEAVISTRNNVSCITLKNFSLKDLTKLSDIKGLNFVKGSKDFKIVVDKKDIKRIKDLFPGKVRKTEEDLAEISIVLTDKVLKQKGVLAEIANEISIHNININEILICPPEFSILVSNKDMVATHEIILGLTE
ncbi:MAG: hypothetical protein AABW58_03570 [Nanoarchaeota archaeon]